MGSTVQWQEWSIPTLRKTSRYIKKLISLGRVFTMEQQTEEDAIAGNNLGGI